MKLAINSNWSYWTNEKISRRDLQAVRVNLTLSSLADSPQKTCYHQCFFLVSQPEDDTNAVGSSCGTDQLVAG